MQKIRDLIKDIIKKKVAAVKQQYLDCVYERKTFDSQNFEDLIRNLPYVLFREIQHLIVPKEAHDKAIADKDAIIAELRVGKAAYTPEEVKQLVTKAWYTACNETTNSIQNGFWYESPTEKDGKDNLMYESISRKTTGNWAGNYGGWYKPDVKEFLFQNNL